MGKCPSALDRLRRFPLHTAPPSHSPLHIFHSAHGHLSHAQYMDPSGRTSELLAIPSQLDGSSSPQDTLHSQLLEVRPNVADCRTTTLVLEGPPPACGHHILTAGDMLCATVHVTDKFGNPTVPAEGELTIELRGPAGVTNLRAEPCPDGTVHTLSEQMRTSGPYTLSASIGGALVSGSSIPKILVNAAPPEGTYSLLQLPATAVAQRPASVLIHCRCRRRVLPPPLAVRQPILPYPTSTYLVLPHPTSSHLILPYPISTQFCRDPSFYPIGP